jgi:hypothetical protein
MINTLATLQHDSYFLQKRDAIGVFGLSTIQKCIVAFQMLANGLTIDITNEYPGWEKT